MNELKLNTDLSEERAEKLDGVGTVSGSHIHTQVHEKTLLFLVVEGLSDSFHSHDDAGRSVLVLLNHSVRASSQQTQSVKVIRFNSKRLTTEVDGGTRVEIRRRRAKEDDAEFKESKNST